MIMSELEDRNEELRNQENHELQSLEEDLRNEEKDGLFLFLTRLDEAIEAIANIQVKDEVLSKNLEKLDKIYIELHHRYLS